MQNQIIKYVSVLTLLFTVVSCHQGKTGNGSNTLLKGNGESRVYSKTVGDSFTISVRVPNNYNPKEKYPVVYLLDANIYFDIMSTTLNKYSEIGLSPNVILVGIGYKNFTVMDSLRNRDYTYPTALAEYEMKVSGGADKFMGFIRNELIPYIDKGYNTDTSKRILMGHSLGAYFTTYALLQHIQGKQNSFTAYIAASPSIHYNKYYMLGQLKSAAQNNSNTGKTKVFVTFGGLEDKEDADDAGMKKVGDVAKQLRKLLKEKQPDGITYKVDVYSNLGHMDTPIPTFLKGLSWALNEDK